MNANPSPYSAPDAIEPVIGWRTWRILTTGDGLRLSSVAYYLTLDTLPMLSSLTSWPARERYEAQCQKHFHAGGEHDAPHLPCKCGIHASKEVVGARGYVNPYSASAVSVVWLAIGRVFLWGKIIEHEEGYRAQYAYPKQLLLPDEIRNKDRRVVPPNLTDIADELHEAYGVPVLIVRQKPTLLERLKGVT